MKTIEEEGANKGKGAEFEFARWLDRSKTAYIYVDQSIESFPRCYPRRIKRPDFLVGLPAAGAVAFEVKAKSLFQGSFLIERYEVLKLQGFQDCFSLPVVYAVLPPAEPRASYFMRNDQLVRSGWREIHGAPCIAVSPKRMMRVDLGAADFLSAWAEAIQRPE